MPILVGIDGTGSSNTEEYNRDTKKSFVRRLCFDKGSNSEYYRGPYMSGQGLSVAIRLGMNFIAQKRRTLGGEEPILLTGHSRGALGVMVIAQLLQEQNINVRAALLFDCVDRHADYNVPVVPSNVERVWHVTRDPRANSRHSFGNAATSGGQHYENHKQYMCTHGGMGGCPWKPPTGKTLDDLVDEGFFENAFNFKTSITYRQDAAVSEEVWADCQNFIRRHRFA